MKPRILVLAKTLPLHDRASGDYRLTRILELLAEEFRVDFLHTTALFRSRRSGRLRYLPRGAPPPGPRLEPLDDPYRAALRALGVNPLAGGDELAVRDGTEFDIRPFVGAASYHAVWIEFYYLAAQYLPEIRRLQPSAHVICDSVDLHFRRLARECNYFENDLRYLVTRRHEKRPARGRAFRARLAGQRRHADFVREEELSAYARCDSVVTVSDDDSAELRRLLPSAPQLLVPNIHRPPASPAPGPSFGGRQGCVFVGNFDHGPNVSSALWLKHEVAPRLAGSGIRFQIVGSNPPRIVRDMALLGPEPQRFSVTGYVPRTEPYLASARISVAPILYGAGMNGKIGEALSAGLPVITSPLGALGMQLTHERNCLVAADGEGFAAAIRRLHDDEALWLRLREGGLEQVRALCSPARLREPLLGSLRGMIRPGRIPAPPLPGPRRPVTLPAPAFPRPPRRPRFSVILLTRNHWRFTELCLRSLALAERAHPGLAEFLLVDNGSDDGTTSFAGKIPGLRVLQMGRNLGFAAGNNRGMEAARGEAVVLLNNDTIVPPHWLACLSRHLDRIPELGLLGPATNTECGQRLPGARYASVGELFSLNRRLAVESSGAWEKTRKLSGLCLAIPRPTLERLGRLDEEFGPGYFEDDDYCLRAADAGLTLALAKDLLVHHFGSVSFGGETGRRRRLEEGMARFAFKWGKRGLEHIARAHEETLLRLRAVRSWG